MKLKLARSLILVALLGPVSALAQQGVTLHPGAETYAPTKIDWLSTVLQANLRTEALNDDGYLMQIAASDPETIVIYVRYLPNVHREVMNKQIDTARRVIAITAKSYGWDSWVKVKEDVKMEKSNSN